MKELLLRVLRARRPVHALLVGPSGLEGFSSVTTASCPLCAAR